MIVPNSGKPEFGWRIHDVQFAHRGMTRICLAGPVFLPDALDIGQRKVELCKRHGLIGLYPLDNAIDPAANDASLTIFRGNENMMIEAETCERIAAEPLASTRMPASS
jgi:hypothetical protein